MEKPIYPEDEEDNKRPLFRENSIWQHDQNKNAVNDTAILASCSYWYSSSLQQPSPTHSSPLSNTHTYTLMYRDRAAETRVLKLFYVIVINRSYTQITVKTQMIGTQVSPACYANVTYMTEMTPRVDNHKFICGLNQLWLN